MNLFQLGNFTSNSGRALDWKVECDALTADDWECLAAMAAPLLPKFGVTDWVMTSGGMLGHALKKYQKLGANRIVICDDVLTTGGSIERRRQFCLVEAGFEADRIIGLVAFARGDWPSWVTPIFALAGCKQKNRRSRRP
jgi:hypothetical protein